MWAIKRCPQPASPCSGCRADVGDRPSTLRVAPGALRERLTFRRWRVDRPLDGGLARRPELCVKFQNGTTQNRRRRCTVERPSEAATGSSRRIVNRVRRDPAGSPVKEWIAGVTAGPGEAGWNLVDAHTRRPSCRSPFDPIEGDALRRGDLLIPGGRAGIPAIPEANLTVSVEPHALPGFVARASRYLLQYWTGRSARCSPGATITPNPLRNAGGSARVPCPSGGPMALGEDGRRNCR